MMDARAWVVTVLYGSLVGFLLARFRREGRVLLGAILSMTVIGVLTWIVSPGSIAGPSMAVGGAASWLAATLAGMRWRDS